MVVSRNIIIRAPYRFFLYFYRLRIFLSLQNTRTGAPEQVVVRSSDGQIFYRRSDVWTPRK